MLFRVSETPIFINESYISVLICLLLCKIVFIFLTPFLLLSFQPTMHTTFVFCVYKNDDNEQVLNESSYKIKYLAFWFVNIQQQIIFQENSQQLIDLYVNQVKIDYNKIIYVNFRSQMHLGDESHVIRYVNTFTVGDWEARRQNQRNRKGITRVTKSSSQNADKYSQVAQMRNQTNLIQNQNRNQSNTQGKQLIDYTSLEHLIEKIKSLELQLTVVQKQKIQLEKKVEELQRTKNPQQSLIESHYITCKQDFDSLLLQKEKMAENISSLQAENNFLKINISIHEQYILKVHSQLDAYRAKDIITQKATKEKYTQTDREVYQMEIKLMLNYGIQTQIQDSSLKLQQIFAGIDGYNQTEDYQGSHQLEYLKQLAKKFEEQTNDFSVVIQKLQDEKILLLEEAQRLATQLKLQEFNKEEVQRLTLKLKKAQSQKEESQKALQQLKLDLSNQREIQRIKGQLNNVLSVKESLQKILQQQKIIHEKQIKSLNSQHSQTIQNINRTQIQQVEKLKIHSQLNLSSQAKYYQQMLRAKTAQCIQRENERDSIKLKLNEASNIYLDRLQQNEQTSTSNKLKQNRKEGQIQILKRLLNEEKQKNHKYYLQFIQLQRKYELKVSKMEQQRTNIQKEYNTYRKQLDSLLGYLQQKSYILQERQIKITEKLQTQEILYKKNEETLRLQSKMQAMIAFNENRVKRIQDQLQQYVHQILLTKKMEESLQKAQLQKNISQLIEENKLLKVQIMQLSEASQKIRRNQKKLLLVNEDCKKDNEDTINKIRLQVFELSQKYQNEVIEKTHLKQQLYNLKETIQHEQTNKNDLRAEIEKIRYQYSFKISQMQSKISSFQRQMKYLEQRNLSIKNEYQARLVQVKKDYDVLYSKYLKYKSLSVHLQEINSRKI